MARVQVLGITRWSYPSHPADFRLTPDDLDEARAKLYAPHRLEHRLFLLDQVVLPALRRQSDPDFTLIFLMGNALPQPYRQRVLELLQGVPQVQPIFADEGLSQQDLVRRLMLRAREPEATAVAEFRLDDDDAVSLDFVADTRRIFSDVRPFFDRTGAFGLDYTRGVIMQTSADGVGFRPITARWWAPGMAVYLRPETRQSVLDYHHMKLWHDMDMLMSSEKPMFIRGVHHANDSSIEKVGKRAGSYPFDRKRKQAFLRDNFGMNLRRINGTWRERGLEFMGLESPANVAAE